MRTACGMRACGKELSTPTAAARHILRHPYPRRSVVRGQLWRVRWNRAGEIAEVTDGPKPPKSGPPSHEGNESGAGQDEAISSDHVSAPWQTTPCLCDCHFGKPECNEKSCQ